MRRYLPAVLAILLVTGCGGTIPFGGVRGSGNSTTETRDVSGFDEIVLEGSGLVTVEVTGTESLMIEAEDNLMSRLTSDVRDGKLILGTTGPISPTEDIVYTVTVVELRGVTISGSGEIASPPIVADHFSAEISGSGQLDLTGLQVAAFVATISGSGNIVVSGTTESIELEISGSGTFSGREFEAHNAVVEIPGSGSAVVNVSDRLEATISGSGTVRYLGDPEVNSDISGSGSVGPE